jgi:hypothetical protein
MRIDRIASSSLTHPGALKTPTDADIVSPAVELFVHVAKASKTRFVSGATAVNR